jgi:pyrimidine operon attenuation protein/uracil phosphoribosyltransferase
MKTIRLNQSDTCFERARKLLEIAGIEPRGFSIAERFAEALAKYQEMDLEHGARVQLNQSNYTFAANSYPQGYFSSEKP